MASAGSKTSMCKVQTVHCNTRPMFQKRTIRLNEFHK